MIGFENKARQGFINNLIIVCFPQTMNFCPVSNKYLVRVWINKE